MKGRFKILGHIGVALFLVSALMLAFMPAAPVQAATEVTDVWVEFAATGANATADTSHANVYYVHFKPTTALSRGVDTVTVTWPDGSEAMGGDGTTNYAFTVDDDTGTADAALCLSDGEVKFSTDYGTTVNTTAASPTWTACTLNGTSAGYRTKVTTPIDIAAGQDVWMEIDSGGENTILGIETPADGYEGTSYKVKVATSQDITPVLSSTFALGDSTEVCSALATEVITSIAGAAAQYAFTITTTHTVSANTGKVTIKFPVGTTVPSSIAATNIQFCNDGSSYSTCAEDPVVDSGRRLITAVTPVDLDGGGNDIMKVLSSAGVTNPTIAAPADTTYKAMVRTTAADQWFLEGSGYAITAGSAKKVAIADGEIGKGSTYPYSDSATMVNMLSGKIYVFIADANGNAVDVDSVTVTPSTSSTSGTFYKSGAADPGSNNYSTITTITVTAPSPACAAQQCYYLDSTAGTHTLTFSASGYTSATWTVTVAPVISLYDANDTLVSTYGAPATTPVAELNDDDDPDTFTQKYGGDYVSSAISAAMTGDTVKLGDGIYELDAYIDLNKKITLTSENGASKTTIRPFDEPLTTPWLGGDLAIRAHVQGTSANPVIIDGLTFDRLRSGKEFDMAIYNNGFSYVTVRNCVFNYIKPEEQSTHETGSVVNYMTYPGLGAGCGTTDITSGTISNNTFNNCCSFSVNAWGNQAANINIMIKACGDTWTNISGVTVSGNTITDCNGQGIALCSMKSTKTLTASVTDNTITNAITPIGVGGYTDSCEILRNTITGGYISGIWVEADDHDNLVIKNNTLTGIAGAGCTASGWDISTAILLWDDGCGDSVNTVQYNDIYDNNATYSIYAKSDIGDGTAVAQDCQYNYFGDATGPYYSALSGATVKKSNPNGTGDKITDLVTYYPWLYTKATGTTPSVVADNVSYQTSTMKLVLGGWNTLSTPVQLIEAANSIDELIPSANMEIGYYYDAGWQQIETGKKLEPCDAVYIKMKSTASTAYVQFKFDASAYSWPSKDLAVGWNLISLASLASSGMKEKPAVASVALTAAGLPGYSQVISPSLNAAQRDMYYNAGTSWTYSYGEDATVGLNDMYAGLGYWIYMQNAATLAGFEITPIVPDLD